MTSIFPIIKRFNDIKLSSNTVILRNECIFYNKCFRAGTIFAINGWREIDGIPYLMLSKGSWEGLIKYDEVNLLMEKLN